MTQKAQVVRQSVALREGERALISGVNSMYAFNNFSAALRFIINDWAIARPDLAAQLGYQPEGQPTTEAA